MKPVGCKSTIENCAPGRVPVLKYKRIYKDFLEIIRKLRLTKRGEGYRHMNQFMNMTRCVTFLPVQMVRKLDAIWSIC